MEAAFLFRFPADERERFLAALDPARCLVAVAEGAIVATLASHLVEVTVPGPRPVAAGALTDLGVAPTHRRRGIGGALVSEFLGVDAVEPGTEALLPILDAGSGDFYGRFGFAPASWAARYRLAAGSGALLEAHAPAGELVMLGPDESLEALPALFERHRRETVGEITRTAESWPQLLEGEKGDDWPFVVAHLDAGELDGYVRYRSRPAGRASEVLLEELVAITPAAYRALYSMLFGLCGPGTLVTSARPTEEAARELLTRPPHPFRDLRAARPQLAAPRRRGAGPHAPPVRRRGRPRPRRLG